MESSINNTVSRHRSRSYRILSDQGRRYGYARFSMLHAHASSEVQTWIENKYTYVNTTRKINSQCPVSSNDAPLYVMTMLIPDDKLDYS